MEIADLVKMTTYVTVPGAVATFRRVRDRRFAGHAPASTYLGSRGLHRRGSSLRSRARP